MKEEDKLYSDRPNRLVIGLIWDDKEGHKARLSEILVPPARMVNLWRNPCPSDESIMAASTPEMVANLSADGKEKKLEEYLSTIEEKLSYEYYWDRVSIAQPISNIYNTKTGTQGDSARDRVAFQVMHELVTVFGLLPNFSFLRFAELVDRISRLPTSNDAGPSGGWGENVREMIEELDGNALTRRFKSRVSEVFSELDKAIQDESFAYENGLSEKDLGDLLQKQHIILVPDVDTEADANAISSLNDGILISVDGGIGEIEYDFEINDVSSLENIYKQIHAILYNNGRGL